MSIFPGSLRARFVYLLAILSLAGWCPQSASAQKVIAQPDGTIIQMGGGFVPGGPAVVEGAPATAANSGEEQPTENGEEGKKEGEKKEGEEKPSDTVKRPTKPPRVPDPREFDAKLDDTERVEFAFHGQSWPDVLQWLASLGGWSLDWQELPNDYINVASNRPFTVTETRDLLNRLLFDRGYTLILRGKLLLVAKIETLDPSLLPRIEDESQLLDLPAHDFVKFTFVLPDELKANLAAEDAKLLVSKHAKVQPLMATNRLLVIDVVGNLREVSRLVNAEHAAATNKVVPKEFPIRYARAGYIADQVMILLGLDPATRRSPQELQVEQQKLQLFMQMQSQGRDISKYLKKGDTTTVHIAVNPRKNSIVVNAEEKELKIIERAIEMLDVPDGQLEGALAADMSMEKYKLATISVEAMVTALEEIAGLDPRTRFKTDSDARILFASATARDHAKIKDMIGQLDGTGRQFEVIWLRRLPADAVAETIFNLMVGKEEEDKKDNDYGYGYYGWGYSSSRSRKKQESPTKGFRVDADIENNRLLLWANEEELKEVQNFLVKLGEIPGRSGNPNTVRVLDPRSADDTIKLLDQLRKIWPGMEENQLQIEGAPRRPAENSLPSEAPAADATDVETKNADARRPATRARLAVHQPMLLDAGNGEPTTASAPKPESPPVTVTVNEDGRLIISSNDTQALDRLEDLIGRIAPPQKNYEVFYLKYALASLVTLNLREYFEEDKDADNSEENYWRGWYGIGMAEDKKDSRSGLARRQKIRFIYDYDTNSVLVSNASPQQLETVKELIEIYDKPPAEDSISARRFQLFKLKFAKADDVANTIKEVYRDLLSSKDQVFQSQNGEKEQASQTTNYYRVYGSSGGGGDDDKKPTKVKASFAGALSIGVDSVSNTVIVSAQEEWMSSISEMINYLDGEAEPYRPSTQVITTTIPAKHLRKALIEAFGAEKQNQQQGQGQQQPGQPQQNPGQTPMNSVPVQVNPG